MRKKSRTRTKTKTKTSSARDRKFESDYYDVGKPASYSGLSSFRNTLPKKLHESASRWLNTQDAYLLHKPVIKKFPRRKVITAGLHEQLQIDLIDVAAYAKENAGVRFLLTCIDVFSKKAWVVVLSRKDGKSTTEAFKNVLDELGFTPRVIQSDQGKEFLNKTFQNELKD